MSNGALGLGELPEAVYGAMLDNPGWGISELVDHLGVAEDQVRGALEDLVDLTLLRPSRESCGRLYPVDLRIGLDLILRRKEEELARRNHELAASRVAAANLVARFAGKSAAGSTEWAERLVGIDAIQTKLEVLGAGVTTECLSVMPGGGQSAASLDASRPLDAAAMARGVRLYTLYQDSIRNDAATCAYAEWMMKLGAQVRTAALLPPRMLIFDRATVVVPIDPAHTKAGALCTREPAVVAVLLDVFRQAWATAEPFGTRLDVELVDGGLSKAERELLLLLAAGLTDQAAANRLGVSLRTIRRQVAALMERLDAASRFEAGLRAGQRGWL